MDDYKHYGDLCERNDFGKGRVGLMVQKMDC